MHAHTDNVKTVYPPQTKFAGGINIVFLSLMIDFVFIANNANLDKMPQSVAFHLGLHCLPKYAFRSH